MVLLFTYFGGSVKCVPTDDGKELIARPIGMQPAKVGLAVVTLNSGYQRAALTMLPAYLFGISAVLAIPNVVGNRSCCPFIVCHVS